MVYTLMSAIDNRILYRTTKSPEPIKYFENKAFLRKMFLTKGKV